MIGHLNGAEMELLPKCCSTLNLAEMYLVFGKGLILKRRTETEKANLLGNVLGSSVSLGFRSSPVSVDDYECVGKDGAVFLKSHPVGCGSRAGLLGPGPGGKRQTRRQAEKKSSGHLSEGSILRLSLLLPSRYPTLGLFIGRGRSRGRRERLGPYIPVSSRRSTARLDPSPTKEI